jgi:shikimate kinase
MQSSSIQNIFLVGLMGSGKTYWGQQLALQNNLHFIDTDQAIEAAVGLSVIEIFTTKGELFFREKETAVLQQFIPQNKINIIATGGGTACFNQNMTWMNNNGITIWLNDSIENIVERNKQNKQQRPLLKTIADKDLHNFFIHQFEERKSFYNRSKYCLNTNEITLTNLKKIIHQYV